MLIQRLIEVIDSLAIKDTDRQLTYVQQPQSSACTTCSNDNSNQRPISQACCQ